MSDTLEFWTIYEWQEATTDRSRALFGPRWIMVDDCPCTNEESAWETARRALTDGTFIEMHHRKPDGSVDVWTADQVNQVLDDMDRNAADEADHVAEMSSPFWTGRI